MFDGLFVTPAVAAITDALSSAHADGKVVVVGNAKLAAALAASREVIAVGLSARASRKFRDTLADTSSLDGRSCGAVIGVDIATDEGWNTTLTEWTRVVRAGGAIVIIDRGHAAEASRRALCAGLTEIEQRHSGRSVVTSGLVTHLQIKA